MFRLPEQPLDALPLRVTRVVELGASAAAAFAVLADHDGWPGWFGGMRRVDVDGPASGVGALRTVHVPPATVQERFSRWDEGERLTFHVVASSLPGLAAMTEDWRLTEVAADRTRLVIDVAAAPARWLAPLAPLVRMAVSRATAGAAGIGQRLPLSS
jgi:hypothetical protein